MSVVLLVLLNHQQINYERIGQPNYKANLNFIRKTKIDVSQTLFFLLRLNTGGISNIKIICLCQMYSSNKYLLLTCITTEIIMKIWTKLLCSKQKKNFFCILSTYGTAFSQNICHFPHNLHSQTRSAQGTEEECICLPHDVHKHVSGVKGERGGNPTYAEKSM